MRRLFFTLFIAVFCISVMAQDIFQWRGPNRNGIYNETGLMKKWPDGGPKMVWNFNELGEGHTSAAVTSTGIFTSGMISGTGYVYALDLKGNLLWKKEYGTEWAESHNGVRSTPLVIKDKLYIMSAYAKLVCMNTSNGQLLWSIDFTKDFGARNITWGITESLLYDGGILYCTPGGPEVNIVAVDRNTGKFVWKSKGNGEKSAYGAPLLIKLGNKKLLVTHTENSILGLDAASGVLQWKFDFPNDRGVHPNTPTYIDGYLYCASGYGKGGVMLSLSSDGTSVKEVWTNTTLDPKFGGVVVLNGKIYGTGDRNKKFFCLDWKTGKEIFSTTELAPGNIISNNGLLYIYSESGKISLIDPKDDKLNIISSFPVPLGTGTHWAHLVINDKKLYVRHGSALMVYDIGA